MLDTSAPPPVPPSALPFPAPPEPGAGKKGCLKWGLVGCAGLSVLLVVSLIVVGTKGASWLFSKVEEQVIASCTPDVTVEEKEAFRRAYRPFVERAKSGKLSQETLSAFRKKTTSALADGRVTAEEIRDLTKSLQESPR